MTLGIRFCVDGFDIESIYTQSSPRTSRADNRKLGKCILIINWQQPATSNLGHDVVILKAVVYSNYAGYSFAELNYVKQPRNSYTLGSSVMKAHKLRGRRGI